jgi:hypothetical protein
VIYVIRQIHRRGESVIRKGDRLKTAWDGKHYEIAGYWERRVVFSPLDLGEEQCLMFTKSEVRELLATAELMRVGVDGD